MDKEQKTKGTPNNQALVKNCSKRQKVLPEI